MLDAQDLLFGKNQSNMHPLDHLPDDMTPIFCQNVVSLKIPQISIGKNNSAIRAKLQNKPICNRIKKTNLESRECRNIIKG